MFVLGASVVMAACSVALAVVVDFHVVVVCSTLFGLSYGTFLSVDFAMVCCMLSSVHA